MPNLDNPFYSPELTNPPQSAKDWQRMANYQFYEMQKAQDELNEYDRLKIKAPYDVIAAPKAHRTMWQEFTRKAQQLRNPN